MKRNSMRPGLQFLSASAALVVFAGCNPAKMSGFANSSSGGGNDHGYGGKVYAEVGLCPDNTVKIKNKIELSQDMNSGLLTIENCEPANRAVSGFQLLASGAGLLFANEVYAQVISPQDSPNVIAARLLPTFIQVQFLSSANREPSSQELTNFQAAYNANVGQNCQWIANTLIRGQESMTMQEAMAARDRSIFIVNALIARAPTEMEISTWSERLPGYTWQNVYDSILATPEFASRCTQYQLRF